MMRTTNEDTKSAPALVVGELGMGKGIALKARQFRAMAANRYRGVVPEKTGRRGEGEYAEFVRLLGGRPVRIPRPVPGAGNAQLDPLATSPAGNAGTGTETGVSR